MPYTGGGFGGLPSVARRREVVRRSAYRLPVIRRAQNEELAALPRGLFLHQLQAALVDAAPADDLDEVLCLRHFKHRHGVPVAGLDGDIVVRPRDRLRPPDEVRVVERAFEDAPALVRRERVARPVLLEDVALDDDGLAVRADGRVHVRRDLRQPDVARRRGEVPVGEVGDGRQLFQPERAVRVHRIPLRIGLRFRGRRGGGGRLLAAVLATLDAPALGVDAALLVHGVPPHGPAREEVAGATREALVRVGGSPGPRAVVERPRGLLPAEAVRALHGLGVGLRDIDHSLALHGLAECVAGDDGELGVVEREVGIEVPAPPLARPADERVARRGGAVQALHEVDIRLLGGLLRFLDLSVASALRVAGAAHLRAPALEVRVAGKGVEKRLEPTASLGRLPAAAPPRRGRRGREARRRPFRGAGPAAPGAPGLSPPRCAC